MAVQNVSKSHKLESLSSQQLIDCMGGHNKGCAGGWHVSGLLYVTHQGGLESESSYPYKAIRAAKCSFNPKQSLIASKGLYIVPYASEQALRATLVKYGPIAVAIDNRNSRLVAYKSGVFFDQNCSSSPVDLNLSALLVGYGKDPKLGEYWILVSKIGKPTRTPK